jgi:hypothetical protein
MFYFSNKGRETLTTRDTLTVAKRFLFPRVYFPGHPVDIFALCGKLSPRYLRHFLFLAE